MFTGKFFLSFMGRTSMENKKTRPTGEGSEDETFEHLENLLS
jgi:hypothetical protein